MIFVFLQGSPSQIDTFDYKPRLQKDDGKPVAAKYRQPAEVPRLALEVFAARRSRPLDLRALSQRRQARRQALHAQELDHRHSQPSAGRAAVAHGAFRFARPSLGSWLLYGLGTENTELPGYPGAQSVDPGRRRAELQQCFPALSLPGDPHRHRRASRSPRPALGHVNNARWTWPRSASRSTCSPTSNRVRPHHNANESDLEGVVQSYELAFRMQGSLPKLFDLTKETPETLDLYGIGKEPTDDFGRQCLLARRAVEVGRPVCRSHLDRLGPPLEPAPGHGRGLHGRSISRWGRCSHDLERRGLLKDTLVLFGGEFGRSADRSVGGRPGPPGRRLHDVAGRRRRSRRARATGPPTSTARRSRTTRCTSTTSTPRCCT